LIGIWRGLWGVVWGGIKKYMEIENLKIKKKE
jgi:hypothetical protein